MMTGVKERPILFSGSMVRAILDGRKTQTRRIVKDQPYQLLTKEQWHARAMSGVDPYGCRPMGSRVLEEMLQECPYGQPGERLWIRESFTELRDGHEHDMSRTHRRGLIVNPVGLPKVNCIEYMADSSGTDESERCRKELGYRWKPSIHMPRWASRINLEITGVRVERLNAISEADAIAEGAQCAGFPAALTNYGAFGQLWKKINGPESWAANPWVWVVEFRKV